MEIRDIQKRAWDNKVAKSFHASDVALEFGLLTAEVSEAFTSWRRLPPFLPGPDRLGTIGRGGAFQAWYRR